MVEVFRTRSPRNVEEFGSFNFSTFPLGADVLSSISIHLPFTPGTTFEDHALVAFRGVPVTPKTPDGVFEFCMNRHDLRALADYIKSETWRVTDSPQRSTSAALDKLKKKVA